MTALASTVPVHEIPATRQIRKPFDMDELVQAVAQAVGRTGCQMVGCESCQAA